MVKQSLISVSILPYCPRKQKQMSQLQIVCKSHWLGVLGWCVVMIMVWIIRLLGTLTPALWSGVTPPPPPGWCHTPWSRRRSVQQTPFYPYLNKLCVVCVKLHEILSLRSVDVDCNNRKSCGVWIQYLNQTHFPCCVLWCMKINSTRFVCPPVLQKVPSEGS